jgi:hypothetical protein
LGHDNSNNIKMATSHQQAASSQQPAASSQQQTVSSKQSAANSQQQTVSSKQSAASCQQQNTTLRLMRFWRKRWNFEQAETTLEYSSLCVRVFTFSTSSFKGCCIHSMKPCLDAIEFECD